MKTHSKIIVAMSGGVDSSVAAALLKKQGYDVIGMMLRLWSEPGTEAHNRCCTPSDMGLARRIAAQLDIPFYAVDAKEAFYDAVVQPFITGYKKGITPNPCIYCNRTIRWDFLLNRALALGADYLATGHYAQIRETDGRKSELLRGIDRTKDQSYVLHVLTQKQLKHTVFPLGAYTKSQVRELAVTFDLPAAERPDSQDLCFLGTGSYRDFLLRNAPETAHPGNIITLDGDFLGKHQGLAFYTIGQRKGLGVFAPNPLYVIEKDSMNNTLVVGTRDQLGKSILQTGPVNWILGHPPDMPFDCQVKIRYKAKEAAGTVIPLDNGGVRIEFISPLRDITPGQSAVMYKGDVCLGGGEIQQV